jgi:hypothetical protein
MISNSETSDGSRVQPRYGTSPSEHLEYLYYGWAVQYVRTRRIRAFPGDPPIIHLIVLIDAPSMLRSHGLGYRGETGP